MESNNVYVPQLSEEKINDVVQKLSSDSFEESNELTELTYKIREIIEKEKKKSFLAGLEEGKKQQHER